MINLKNVDSNLLKIDKKHCKGGYITLKQINDCKNIYIVNFLYLLVNYANGYIEENGNKYLIFDDSVNQNKWVLKIYEDVWDGMKNKIKTVNDGEKTEKNYMKIKFNSYDDLLLNKPLKFREMTINIRSVFEEGGKLHLQVYLGNCLYELHVASNI